ncbi:MAG: hypothetical protein HQK56_13885 [Deltaproteobacteria bacterium]|nr:hypothetical protein [Deltaproteobacteria bacterium]
MFKITITKRTHKQIFIRVDGPLIGPTVAGLRKICFECIEKKRRPNLDLRGVTQCSQSGVALLKQLQDRVDYSGCPLFVHSLITAGTDAEDPAPNQDH